MDSFYDAPRRPPVPTTINRIERVPVVPEVSVVENSFYHPRPCNPFDYNARMKPHNLVNDKPCMSLEMNKKHVRFENASNRYPHSNFRGDLLSEKENVPVSQPLKTVPDLSGKSFKQIYMANVPDRHLDLSIFEPPSKALEARAEPNFDSAVLAKVCHHHDTNILKSIENKPALAPPPRDSFLFHRNESLKSSQNCTEIAKPSDEPTIKDLFKIIQQQNEQIMLLQRQVNNLKSSIRQPEPDPIPFDNVQDMRNSPTKKGLFSIDFQTTSFEVSFRPPPGKFRKQNDFLEPKIQEIVECDSSKDNRDISLHLEESLHVKDSYVSAVPSIQINMDDYQSSDEEESVNIGITFYKDLMDQVNNVLKKMQSECQMASGNKKKIDMTGQTMNAVKQATLQHLKSIGVNLSPIQETNEITGGSDFENRNCDPSEVSFAVKQLLMKYLPDDKLTKAINKQKQPPLANSEKKKFKPPGSEFSFATLQYLKKYNIIDNRKLPELERKASGQQISDPPKILDVTALKRQPKLL